MAQYEDALNALRKAFVGKVVSRVEPSDAAECMARFYFADGTGIRYFATELGFWIEDLPGDKGFSSLHQMMVEFGHHAYNIAPNFGYAMIEPTITWNGESSTLTITAPDGKEFVGIASRFSDHEQKIVLSPKGRELLAKWAELGDCWKIGFSGSDEDCPKELLFPKEAKDETQ